MRSSPHSPGSTTPGCTATPRTALATCRATRQAGRFSGRWCAGKNPRLPRCTGPDQAAQDAEEDGLRLPLGPARIRRPDAPLTPRGSRTPRATPAPGSRWPSLTGARVQLNATPPRLASHPAGIPAGHRPQLRPAAGQVRRHAVPPQVSRPSVGNFGEQVSYGSKDHRAVARQQGSSCCGLFCLHRENGPDVEVEYRTTTDHGRRSANLGHSAS